MGILQMILQFALAFSVGRLFLGVRCNFGLGLCHRRLECASTVLCFENFFERMLVGMLKLVPGDSRYCADFVNSPGLR